MSEILSKIETRGRPRKNTYEKLPLISRQLFSEHCAVFYACCMVYVLEVFLKTKQEKRIGHSEGGFTIYQKSSQVYCFDTFEQDLKQWGFADAIMGNRGLYDFIRTANGCAPKFVFRELVTLFVQIHYFLIFEKIQSIQELEACQNRLLNLSEADMNKLFKYIRFTSMALKQLKMQKWIIEVNKKIKDLWKPFIKVISYTIFCVQHGIQHNKYLKPFFSDAERPEQTIIGQLNLEQIVQEKEEKHIQSSNLLGFTKIPKSFEEELQEKSKMFQLDKSITYTERTTPLASRRPITLITFPSNSKIQTTSSPTKPNYSQKLQRQEVDEIGQTQHIYPSKKIKQT